MIDYSFDFEHIGCVFTVCVISPFAKANPVNIPMKPLPKLTMRNSVEGLNQEIERLVLKSNSSGMYLSDRSEDYDKVLMIKWVMLYHYNNHCCSFIKLHPKVIELHFRIYSG